MAGDKDSDVGRVMAVLEASSLAYCSFAAPSTGPSTSETAASRAAAFPLLVAALPELMQIDTLPILPASPEPGAVSSVVAAPDLHAALPAAPAMPQPLPSYAGIEHATQPAAPPPYDAAMGRRQPFAHQPQADARLWQQPAAGQSSWQRLAPQPMTRMTAQPAVSAQPFPPNPAGAPEPHHRSAQVSPSSAQNAATTPLAAVFRTLRVGDTPQIPTRRQARCELQDMFGSL